MLSLSLHSPRLLLSLQVDTYDPELTQIAVCELISHRGPSHDWGRARRLEGVDALARLDVVTLNARAFVTSACYIVAIPRKA